MAKLTTEGRKHLKDSDFALPDKRMFPIHDADHARAALFDVSKALSAGSITAAEAATVRHKARAKLRSEE